jgi:peptidoglycan/xylan/chitin deacetylase (PgdA/CDA1 family)
MEHNRTSTFLVRVRSLLRWFWVNLLLITGFLEWAKRDLKKNGAVVVLAFHRVLRESDSRRSCSLRTMVVEHRNFRKLALWLKRHYQVVDVAQAQPGYKNGKLRIAVTFDDGWIDNYYLALPIVRSCGIPIAVFVCPGLIGQKAPFWPERVVALLRAVRPHLSHSEVEAMIDQLKRQTPDERELFIASLRAQASASGGQQPISSIDQTLFWPAVAEMNNATVRFGSHTQKHSILTAAPPDKIHAEIAESKRTLEQMLSKPCEVFAYPYGEASPQARKILAEENFRLAFTLEQGVWTETSDRLRIPRINVWDGKLVNPWGRFSPVMFDYCVLWKAWRAERARARRNARRNKEVVGVRAPSDKPASASILEYRARPCD